MAASLLALSSAPAVEAQPSVTDQPLTPAAAVARALARVETLPEARTRRTGRYAVTDLSVAPETGVTHVYLQQLMRGLPVHGSTATVSVARDGAVVHTAAQFSQTRRDPVMHRPRISAQMAVAQAAARLGIARDTLDATQTLGYEPSGAGTLRLAWLLELASGPGAWAVSVDAETGHVLRVTDHADHEAPTRQSSPARVPYGTIAPPLRAESGSPAADNAHYRVYAQPLESPNDGPRTLVTNPADPVFSPLGWHDLDGEDGPDTTSTRGNNVTAFADTIPDLNSSYGEPDPASAPDGGSELLFDYPAEHAATPLAARDAAVTNMFYWVNVMHDFTARFGFTEAAGNFQVTNYTGLGKGHDAVTAQAQDSGGVENSYFVTPPDGAPPTMTVYLWAPLDPEPADPVTTSATVVRDAAFDAGVIAHEFGHGVSRRLTGGPTDTTCLDPGGYPEEMGEGWSDFFAYAATMRASDAGESRGIATYLTSQRNRSSKGIRPTPYSTDLDINPTTYDAVKAASGPHSVGYVWASMLWDVYWDLVKAHGFNARLDAAWNTGGNNLAVQLVMDGLKFQPCQPGFVEGRDAIIAADEALTGGENRCLLWRAFARRGLGVNARQGTSRSVADGREGFLAPDNCRSEPEQTTA
jgi:hypothetical protein